MPRLFLIASALFGAVALAEEPASFTPLGDLPGGRTSSAVLGVSPNGEYVVGLSSVGEVERGTLLLSELQPFIWHRATGMVSLGPEPLSSFPWKLPARFDDYIGAVDDEGNVTICTQTTPTTATPVAWMSGRGPVALFDDAQGEHTGISVWGIARGGQAICGTMSDRTGTSVPFVWSAQSGFRKLQYPEAGQVQRDRSRTGDSTITLQGGCASAVTDLGDWASGYVLLGQNPLHPPAVWDSVGGFHVLTLDRGDVSAIELEALSEDGAVVAGTVLFELPNGRGARVAFRWPLEGEIQFLEPPGVDGDFPADWRHQNVFAMDATGSRIVGSSPTLDGTAVVVWDQHGEGTTLRELLIDAGVYPDDLWPELGVPVAISADGRVLAGTGLNSDEHSEAWVVRLPGPE